MVYSTPTKRVLFVRRSTPVLLVIFGVFSLLVANLHSPKLAYATASATVNFQARLQSASGAIVPDGTYNLEFKLYDATGSSSNPGSCSGNCVWYEDYTGANKVTVKDGYLSVQLGSQTAFSGTIDWSQQLYLTMDIGGTGSPSWDGEMLPRLALTATPYSFLSQRALTSDNADQISTTNANGTNTLSLQGPSSGNGGQNFVLQDQGASGTYYLLAANGSGNVSVSGLATAANIATGSVDRSTAGTLTIGSSTATALSLGNTSTNIATTINGTAIVKPTSGHDTTGVFQVQDAGSHDLIDVDTSTETVNLGAAAAAMASTVNVATSTTTGQTVNIASGAITSGTNTVNIGTGATSSGADAVNIGSGNAGSATNVQGGTGGLLLGTGSTTGDSGTISIQSGDSSSGTSGNVLIDTGSSAVSTPTNAEQDTFESGTDHWVNWFNTSVAQSSVQHHPGTGSNSLAITNSSATPPDTWGAQLDAGQAYAVTPGQLYNFSAWVYSATSQTLNLSVGWGSGIQSITDVTIPAGTWTELSGSLVAPSNATGAVTILGSTLPVANGVVTYLDDVTVTGGGSSPLVALGANNAASILVGNQAEVGPTTIQGGSGGVNIVTGDNGDIAIGNLAGTGAVALLGEGISQTITGDASNPSDIIKTTTNSTTAFQVQNASAASILNVNTASGAVIIGSTANGGLLVNDGATLNTAKAISDVSGGGSIGSAASTVDIYTTFAISQTTSGKTLSLASPTDTTAGRVVLVLNTGSTSFTMGGLSLGTGTNASFIWNGSAWTAAVSGVGAGGGVTTIGTVGSNGQSADGASISGSTLYMQYADSTSFSGAGAPGLVSTGTQGFKGQKTFADLLTAGNGLTVNSAAITGNAGLTVGTGAVLLNQGATENTILALSNFSSNGAMTTAGNINSYTGFTINQTTASVSLTLPSPTNDASNMHMIYVSNIGSVTVTVGGTLITAGSFATFSWNGSSWASIAGGSTGGSYISSQTTVQSANFFVQAAASNSVAGKLQANGSGTGDILDLLNGAGTPVATFASDGTTLIKPSSNSTTAFQIQPSGSTTPVFDVDTSNGRVGINMNNPAYALDVNGAINTNTAVYVGGVSVCTTSCTPSGGSGNYIQNSTAVQTSANFFLRSASSSAVTGVLQGANGQSADMLDLQTWNGTSATTVDKFASDGSFTVKTSSTAAMAIQNSGGTNTLLVDTTDGTVGIGTSSASTRPLTVAVNTSSTNTLPLLLQQTGSGDVGIELQTSGANFFTGIDNTDGSYKIATNASANGTFQVGNYVGASGSHNATGIISGGDADSNADATQALKITPSATGTIQSMSVYFTGVDASFKSVQYGIYSDSGGAPATLLASSSAGTLSATGWFTLPISGITLNSGTSYWIAMTENGNGDTYAKLNTGLDSVAFNTVSGFSLPNPFASNVTDTYSPAFYVTVASDSGSNNFGGTNLFTLSSTGAAKFQNYSDSTSAFSIQNASGGSLFNVDTTNGQIVIGTGAIGESTAKVLVLDNQTGTGAEPTEVDGGMYYNANLKVFRCGVGGTWQSCGPMVAKLTSDFTTSSQSATNVTGLTFSVAASTDYSLTCNLMYTSTNAGTGIRLGLNGPTSFTSVVGTATIYTNVGGSTASTTTAFNAADNTSGASSVNATGTLYPAQVSATFRNGTNAGTLALRVSTNAANNISIKTGSSCQLVPLK